MHYLVMLATSVTSSTSSTTCNIIYNLDREQIVLDKHVEIVNNLTNRIDRLIFPLQLALNPGQ